MFVQHGLVTHLILLLLVNSLFLH